MSKVMGHDELQHLEHCNKILEEHLELVQKVTNETESLLNTYLPILSGYVRAVVEVQMNFGKAVVEITRSAREVKVITSGSQEIENFVAAAVKLNNVLNDELMLKIIKLAKDKK